MNSIFRTAMSSAVALLILAAPAAAVTVKNTGGKPFEIGIDYGAKSTVQNVPADKAVTFQCKEGCGVSGPWGFSWLAKGDDSFTSNGQSLSTVKG
jgi:hypothetical protein